MPSQDTAAGTATSAIPRFDSELVYQLPSSSRAGMLAVSLGLIVVTLAFTPLLVRLVGNPEYAPFGLRCLTAAIWLALVGYCAYMALTVRNRFVVGFDRVTLRDWRRTRSLPFEDIAGCTVDLVDIRQPTWAPPVHGMRLTLRSGRAGATPLSLVVDERVPIDIAIIERLMALPVLSPHALKPLERMATTHRQHG